MPRIYIFCPGDIISGGVNSLQMLCKALNNEGYQAGICYINQKKHVIEQLQLLFGNPIFEEPSDHPGNIFVFPETMTEHSLNYKNAKIVIYWLSIHFFFKVPPHRIPFTFKIFQKLISTNWYNYDAQNIVKKIKYKIHKWNKYKSGIWDPKIYHIVNSFYIEYFLKQFGINRVHVLHNPVRDEFYNSTINTERSNIILVGPRTPKYIFYLLKKRFSDYQVIRIKNFKPEALFALFQESKLVVELGAKNRDRIIREAALLGCIVLISNYGGGSLYQDTPIPSFYKIKPSVLMLKELIAKVDDICANYEKHYTNLSSYKDFLIQEKINFPNNVKKIFFEIAK